MGQYSPGTEYDWKESLVKPVGMIFTKLGSHNGTSTLFFTTSVRGSTYLTKHVEQIRNLKMKIWMDANILVYAVFTPVWFHDKFLWTNDNLSLEYK